ncbi:integrase catalytic domain-containing protein [Advenella mimigardefordensis]|uniref:Putative integrase core domain-containing TnsB protein n=1 Tax=Advenella mimigardefordensis (strain DSM 17166 / LMG 22922 / DPN7) TaxID=1247726 RepID=W0PHL8_ADVMD|nr:DDE-type integrase/transposase/recombinase [Advenella mimigardefordensis]AHG65262.1 putative integrase core domain-containing TnsB protein [Advenella mimigardefordensis DPN7]
MAKFQLKDGLVLQRGKQLLKFQRMLPENLIQLENVETGLIEKMSLDELLDKIERKELIVQGGSHVCNAISVKLPNVQSSIHVIIDTARFSAKAKAKYERKINYVLRCKKEGVTQGCIRQITRVIATIAANTNDKNPPAPTTVADWLRIYNQSGCDNRSLLPKPRMSRKIGERIGQEKLDLIHEFITRYYLQRSGKSIEDTYNFLSSEMRTRLGEDAYVSISTVKKIIRQISPYEREKIREGAAFAAARWRHAIGGINAEYPLQVVEIDHTELSIYVIDSRIGIVLGRPIITIIIDSCTGYILSLVISFEGTTVARVVRAIKFALTPKNKIVAELGLKNEWITPGLWQTMLTDNASEFHAADANAIALQMGFDVERSPVRKPWFKPGVERSMLSVVNALPRYGRSELIQGVHKPIDPKKTASIAFDDLHAALIKWAVDIYPFKISDRTQDCAFDRMKEGLKKVPAPVFNDDLRALDIFAAIPTRVKVSQAGIEKFYLDYRSRGLAKWQKNMVQNSTWMRD